MEKKVWSIILLCLLAVLFIITVVIFVKTGIAIYELENTEIDSSNSILPLGGLFALTFVVIGLLFGFVQVAGFVASVGWILSLICIKIAPNSVIKRISNIALCFYSIVLILLVGIVIYALSI